MYTYKKIILFLIVGLFFFAGNISEAACPGTDIEGLNDNWESSSLGVCFPTGTELPDSGGDNPLATVLNNVMLWLLRVVGFIAIIAFVISGMQYMLAAGDTNIMETAKRNMVWSIVGVVVALMGLVIFVFIFNMLS